MQFISLPSVSSVGLLATLLAGTLAGAGHGMNTADVKAPPAIRVDVNLALVPVTVMDANGRNVLGLDRDNFRVLDGSQLRPIVSFNR